jgi:hypothetical protein
MVHADIVVTFGRGQDAPALHMAADDHLEKSGFACKSTTRAGIAVPVHEIIPLPCSHCPH